MERRSRNSSLAIFVMNLTIVERTLQKTAKIAVL